MRHRAMLIVTAAVLASGCARTTIDHSIPTDYPRTDDTAALEDAYTRMQDEMRRLKLQRPKFQPGAVDFER